MLRLMLQKMWHKKWMNISLLFGCILMIATVVSFPLYRNAAYDRMLNEEFNNYLTSEGKWPTMIKATVSVKKERGGTTITKMDEFPEYFYNTLGVNEADTFRLLNVTATAMSSDTGRLDAQAVNVKLGAIDNVESKLRMLSGEVYSESGLTEDGAIEVIVSQSCLVNKRLLVGEYFTFDNLNDFNGKKVRVYIKGVYDASLDSGYFWQIKPETLSDTILCKPSLFREYFTADHAHKYSLSSTVTAMFDYSTLKAGDVERILASSDYIFNESTYKSVVDKPDYTTEIANYQVRVSRISATLLILQIPVLAMLVTFLFMISGQMYEMEKNEISVIKSRGSSRFQIIRLYFYQGTALSLMGLLAGMPLGRVFASFLGATKTFLEFDFSNTLDVSFTKEALYYGLGAFIVCFLAIMLPSIKHSKVSIVNLKQSKALKKKAWWEKMFLDVILLGVSLYGYYSFKKDGGSLSNAVLAGESLDPLLYVSSSLFILGAGLLFLRVQPLLVKLVYNIGKKYWGPATHISFMDNIKNGRKQQLIMLFLIMTISLGMYHATVARTILENAVENTEYLAGSDVVIKEVWTEIRDENGVSTGEYLVPNVAKYNTIEALDKFTRVIYEDASYIKNGSNESVPVCVMGIHTKEFGEITMVDREYLDKHYYSYLNDLAVVENGVLLSTDFNTKLGFEEGDVITYFNKRGKATTGKIVGFIDYFPGYNPVSNGLNPDGTAYSKDNYLIVSHFDYLTNKWGTYPYEIWIKLKDGYTAKDVYAFINDNKIQVSKYINREIRLNNTLTDPLLQGTNGVLTMGFAVTIILCAVGYLIYWIMSIKERELIFGVLRAMGFHKSEVIKVLVNEQIFSGLLSVVSGIGIGILTSKLFVPILQEAYASEDQALPMRLITNAADMYKLYGVILAVIFVVLIVLISIISRMNVTKALKLGEE